MPDSEPSKRRPRQRKHRSHSSSQPGLTEQILKLISVQPLDKIEISKRLGLPPDQRAKLRDLLRTLESNGKIARIRKDRYIIPQEADLFTGTIQFHPSGAAHILNETKGSPDLYISAENTWTALPGDKVVARIHTDRRIQEWRSGQPAKAPRLEGRVIRILERVNEVIVGTLQRTKNFCYVVPDDPRFVHNLYVKEPVPPLHAKVGDKVVAKLEAWPTRHVNPEGKIIEVLGAADKPGVDMLAIIRKHRLPEKFPNEVIAEAKSFSPIVTKRDLAGRADLRGQLIITIDPDDARDFDDAVIVERTANGWRAGIHIADVSHYVRPRTALDREAYARGNSVYLPDRVIPMLPEALSNGICSLRPEEDRLVFSVFAEINKQGVIKQTRFGRSVIRSAKRLTYKEAFAILQKPPRTEIEERVHVAWELSSVLRRRRFERGSLELDFPEVKVWVDENGKPTKLEKVENDISHQLIEELMLLANESVARELKVRKQPTVYRVHESPDDDRLNEFRDLAMTYGLRCGDLSQRDEMQKLLRSTVGKSFEYAIKIGLLKSLKRARYTSEPLGHFGLAKPDYLHFTSPIRRYADLIAHRSLERHLGLTKTGPASDELETAAEHISTTERVAADAEKEAVKLKKLEFFQQQISQRRGGTFRARIIEVRNYGLFVELPEFLLTGLIHVSALEGDFFVHELSQARFIGRQTKKTYRAGDELEVVVARVDMFKQQVDFRPA